MFPLKIRRYIDFISLLIRSIACQTVEKRDVTLEFLWGALRVFCLIQTKRMKSKDHFFFSHCANFLKVFRPMINLKKNKDYVLTLLEGLKCLNEENKSLTEKLTEKENLKRKLNEEENLKCEKENLKQLVLEKGFLESKLEKILTEIEVENETREDEHCCSNDL